MTELSKVTIRGKLVPKVSWQKYIESLKVREVKLSKEQAADLVADALVEAVRKRIPDKKFGILFSGGVDSTLIAFIAKKLKKDFICYSVGVKNSQDLEWSKKIAKKLKLSHKQKQLTEAELEKIIKKVIKIVGGPDVVKVGVGSVFYAAAELAKKDKISILFSGLGSEEIFAGYERHAAAKNINKECWNGLSLMWERDLVRDYKIAAALRLDIRTPFLDGDLIQAAMKVPGEYKISGDTKKAILREAAVRLGLENEFAYRKKVAAQYGSKFDHMLEQLARKNGDKFKKEYLQSLFHL